MTGVPNWPKLTGLDDLITDCSGPARLCSSGSRSSLLLFRAKQGTDSGDLE